MQSDQQRQHAFQCAKDHTFCEHMQQTIVSILTQSQNMITH